MIWAIFSATVYYEDCPNQPENACDDQIVELTRIPVQGLLGIIGKADKSMKRRVGGSIDDKHLVGAILTAMVAVGCHREKLNG